MDPGFDGARFPLLNPLFGLPFGFRGVVRHHRLVHGDDVVQHGLGPTGDGSDKLCADSHTLLLLVL